MLKEVALGARTMYCFQTPLAIAVAVPPPTLPSPFRCQTARCCLRCHGLNRHESRQIRDSPWTLPGHLGR
eukprot:6470551-Amphidinium_carterae.1